MLARPVGLNYSADPEQEFTEGDVIVSMMGTATYRVLSARRVKWRVRPHNNWRLICLRIPRDAIETEDTVHPLYWHPRGRRRAR